MGDIDAVDRTLSKARLEALSDGVFAIAMTLLVLDIRIPEIDPHTPVRAVLRALVPLGPALMSFAITFILSGAFWYMHHVTLHSTKHVTRPIASINFFFLMFVSLLPFSTGLLGRLGPNHPAALAVYFTNQLALGVILNLHWVYAVRRGLIVPVVADPIGRFMIRVQPIACLAALGMLAFAPIASYYAFLLVMLVGRRIGRRRFSPADRACAPTSVTASR
jgi:TMEM175 potassium channel family protein